MALHSADTTITAAVAETLQAVPYDARDTALRLLIARYAAALDNDGDIEQLGSRLLSALEALGATPRARKGTERINTSPSRLEAFNDAQAG